MTNIFNIREFIICIALFIVSFILMRTLNFEWANYITIALATIGALFLLNNLVYSITSGRWVLIFLAVAATTAYVYLFLELLVRI